MVKVQKTGNNQYFITIPGEIIRSMNIDKGDELDFFLEPRGNIVLVLRKVNRNE